MTEQPEPAATVSAEEWFGTDYDEIRDRLGIDPDTTDAQIHELALSAVAAAQPARLVGVVEYLNSLREAKVMHLQWDEEGEKYILSSDPRQP